MKPFNSNLKSMISQASIRKLFFLLIKLSNRKIDEFLSDMELWQMRKMQNIKYL